MSKPKFSAGDIVRKCTASGTPIGPWLKIIAANAHNVWVGPSDNSCECLEAKMDRNRIWIPKKARLCVSNHTIKRVLNGDIVVSHPVSKNWIDLYENRPDIVELYTTDGMYKVWCTIDGVKVERTYTETIVKLIIDRIICY